MVFSASPSSTFIISCFFCLSKEWGTQKDTKSKRGGGGLPPGTQPVGGKIIISKWDGDRWLHFAFGWILRDDFHLPFLLFAVPPGPYFSMRETQPVFYLNSSKMCSSKHTRLPTLCSSKIQWGRLKREISCPSLHCEGGIWSYVSLVQLQIHVPSTTPR